MKVKPKEIMVNLPVALLFDTLQEAAAFASSINTIIHGKVKVKYDELGRLTDKEVVLFYLYRNDEYHEIREEFKYMIEQEEIRIDKMESVVERLREEALDKMCPNGHPIGKYDADCDHECIGK